MAAGAPQTISTVPGVVEVVREVGGGTGPARGQELYDFLREKQPDSCLELGFARGVSSLYIGAALEANGKGHLTSVDREKAKTLVPSATDLVARAGLGHRIELVHEATTYNWYLYRRIHEQTRDGRCEPYLDFCFIDGAHTWVDDGLAFFLVNKLLRPGGWLLFDDLPWRTSSQHVPPAEREVAQVQQVFDLLVMQHPTYDHFETDGRWAWARKSATAAEPQVRTVVRRDVPAVLRQAGRALRSGLRG
jgi:predicted O-methyltransferase YrrM